MNQVSASLVTRDLPDLTQGTENVYASVVVISKRARQLASKIKEELSTKLSNFESTVDNLEEVFENREQIEISRFYERLPKTNAIALKEFLEDKLFVKHPSESKE